MDNTPAFFLGGSVYERWVDSLPLADEEILDGKNLRDMLLDVCINNHVAILTN